MGNTTIFRFIFTKNIKKIQHLSFTDKVKIIKVLCTGESKIIYRKKFSEEIKYFQKKNIHLKLI